ncbi:hypothetical protein [Nocardia stercoris]|uniref:Uncharacterized protein n=1 Tax=Nocardia stercoris TaxID=2483361 RepID=A0A3M2KS16_9NOCA|nr:hypothetical protein [Nocardia stercoris]RMI28269.1 hypothetical protein EBN03_30965 [Nocardia stercoris]
MLSPLVRSTAILTATAGIALSVGAGAALAQTTTTTPAPATTSTGSGTALAAQLYQVSPLLADLACIVGGEGGSYGMQGPLPGTMQCSNGSVVAY